MVNGKLIKGIGGFYYVEAAGRIYECKAKGIFRKNNITPLAGDDVVISINSNSENRIEEIKERRNCLIRPPVANLDRLFIVSSIVEPEINTFNIDKLISIAEYKSIEPILVFTKIDLSDNYKKYTEIYKKAGFITVCCNNISGDGADEVRSLLKDKISAFTGNTGAGKSSLLNCVDEDLLLATGAISKKLGRGRHTTRHTELFKVNGGYVADTPGFSSLDFEKCERIMKADLFDCFREFEKFFGQCKFSTCAHINEKGCAICKAVCDGAISESRHNSYIQMYNNVKDIKEWELRK